MEMEMVLSGRNWIRKNGTWLRQNCAGELSLVESSYCGSEVIETAWMDRLAVEGFSGV
jgi:hypothetical protein